MAPLNPTVYIPTLGRTHRQITWSFLPSEVQERTWLVCPPSDVREHERFGRHALACPVHGIHRVRQWILDHAATPTILMLDDDLRFFRRIRPDDWHLKTTRGKPVGDLIATIGQLLCQGYVHVGLSMRQGNQTQDWGYVPGRKQWHQIRTGGYRFFGRQCMAYGFLVPALRALGVRFRTRLMQDFDVALQLLRQGYANPHLYAWCAGQDRSNTRGGCSTYRTAAMLTNLSKKLHQLHPAYVRLVQRNADWRTFDSHQDVHIYWARAWMDAPIKHGNWSDPAYQALLTEFAGRRTVVDNLLGTQQAMLVRGNRPGIPKGIVICENRHGKIRHRTWSPASWKASLEDSSVCYRWTHLTTVECESE